MTERQTSDEASGTPFDDGELYDALFNDFPYGVDFYVDLARQARGPVLDVGCGTGRILLACAQAGAEVDGLDLSEPMLDTLRAKATALGLAPRLRRGDMAEFRLERRYALVMITFNGFIHNLTPEAQIGCLECCREHLAPGGRLAFDLYFPGLSIIGAPENRRVLEFETTHPRTGAALRLYDTRRFDRVEQLQHSLTEIEVLGERGEVVRAQRSEYAVRWVYKSEMALLLRAAGFRRWEIFGGFDRRPLTAETDAMVVLADLTERA